MIALILNVLIAWGAFNSIGQSLFNSFPPIYKKTDTILYVTLGLAIVLGLLLRYYP